MIFKIISLGSQLTPFKQQIQPTHKPNSTNPPTHPLTIHQPQSTSI